MYLEKIELVNWRNLEKVELSFPEKVLVLGGDNAQGKTNFLEALFLLARGVSPRRARDEEMIRWGKEFSYLRAQIREENLHFTREVVVKKEGKKEWKRDGKRETRRTSLPLVGYFPQDQEIIEGPPQKRRDFLDEAISFLSPSYGGELREYEKLLYRRNFLLREHSPSELLEIYGEKLISCGAKVVETRIRYLHQFVPYFQGFHRELSGEDVSLQVAYRSSGYRWEEGIEEGLRKARERVNEEERERGMTLFGPHRDEIVFLLRGREARDFASQGEKKRMAISLRLAETSMAESFYQKEVVILVDDIFSELDRKRRNLLWQKIKDGSQVFLTTTEEEEVKELKGSYPLSFFRVEGGRIERGE
ncbi:MAG TPA: DNA replication and repair protein RecF [Candidatus Atribacteria bacterium]|nr:DNA replication and repair protein RecF [Candidatus Atribacteria bacterium]